MPTSRSERQGLTSLGGLLAAAVLAAACGRPSRRVVERTVPDPGRGARPAALKSSGGALVLDLRPVAESYGGPERRTRVEGFCARVLAKAMRRGAFWMDRRLDRAAALLAGLPSGLATDQKVVRRLAWSRGLVEPVPAVVLLGCSELADCEAAAGRRVATLAGNFRRGRLGCFLGRRQDAFRAVLLVQESHLALAPVPRRVAAGGTLRLRGRLEEPYRRPSLVLTLPSGRAMALGKTPGPDFDWTVTLRQPGTYQVEILAEGPKGPWVVANFPVACQVALPTALVLPRRQRPAPRDPEQVEQYLFAALNRLRRRSGLPPLAWDGRLAAVARAHSLEMCRTGSFGHESARTGRPEDRVARAGIRAEVVAENVAMAADGRAVHEALMASPGHRANLLSRDVTRVGIGAVRCRTSLGLVELYVTQLFIRPGRRG